MNKTQTAIPVRRIVTGHDANGKSIIVQDDVSPFTLSETRIPGLVVTDLWKTFSTPANTTDGAEPCSSTITLTPPKNGSVFRTVQFPPDASYKDHWNPEEHFAAMGSAGTLDPQGDRKVAMHRTHSIDYAIVISGEIYALMDDGETLMRPGDVLVQRGTNHGWSNRSDAPALVAFVLIDAEPVSTGKA